MKTLFERGGDCEDTSILVTALLDRMSYDTVDDRRYYNLETTGEGFKIGHIPSDFTETSAHI